MVHGALIAEILRLDEERVAGGEGGRRRVEEVEATVVLGGNAPSATHTRGHRGICALARVSTLGSGFWLLLGLAVEVLRRFGSPLFPRAPGINAINWPGQKKCGE